MDCGAGWNAVLLPTLTPHNSGCAAGLSRAWTCRGNRKSFFSPDIYTASNIARLAWIDIRKNIIARCPEIAPSQR